MDSSVILNNDEFKNINLKNTININIGVLGHIDSGKTSLARILSKVYIIILFYFRSHQQQVWIKILRARKEVSH